MIYDFEGLGNGQALGGDELGALVHVSGGGANAGPAIFDSSPGGPNDPSQDLDLLVGRGNLLILQRDGTPMSEPGTFDLPNDDEDGGFLLFRFARPTLPRSLALVDISPEAPLGSTVTLRDEAGRERVFLVPPGFTNDLVVDGGSGVGTLALDHLEPQAGAQATATATEDTDFRGDRVVELIVSFATSGAVDDLFVEAGVDGDVVFPGRNFPIAASTRALATADLNRDGHPDIVGVAPQTGLTPLFNLGDGSFRTGPALPIPPGEFGLPEAIGVVAGDLDGQNGPDLVTLRGGSEVLVFLNDGQGQFPSFLEFQEFPGKAGGVQCADLDGDGLLDLLLEPFENDAFVKVLKGRGDGYFEDAELYRTPPGNTTEELLIADFNGDDALDFVVDLDSEVLVFLNRGDGTFNEPQEWAAPQARAMAVADYDQDGDVDLAVAGQFFVTFLENQGGADFSSATTSFPERRPRTIEFLDLDGDGVLDLAVQGTEYLQPLIQQQGESFVADLVQPSAMQVPWDSLPVDVDGDGHTDLVTCGQTPRLTVLLSGEDGLHLRKYAARDVGGIFFGGILVADFDSDSFPDVVMQGSTGDVHLLRNDGLGALQAPRISSLPSRVLAYGDFNGDNLPDLVGEEPGGRELFVSLNLGDGFFGEHSSYFLERDIQRLVVGDLDGNGLDDVAVTAVPFLQVLFAQEDGSFELETLEGFFQSSLLTLDLGGDGDQDLFVSQLTGTAVFENHGNGELSPRGFLPGIFGAAAADLDGDGYEDLIFLEAGCFMASFQDEEGEFFPGRRLFESTGIGTPITGDVDGDGDIDILESSEAVLHLNRGNGSFSRARSHHLQGVSSSRIVDLDGDLLAEILSKEFMPFSYGLTVMKSRY